MFPVDVVNGINNFETTPTEVIFGVNCLKEIKNVIKKFNPKKILLISGQKTVKRTGISDYLRDYETVIYKIKPSPTIQTIKDGLGLLNKNNPDLIISIGGGSAIDTGKTIAILSKNPGSVRNFLLKEVLIKNNGLPFIAIPTTAGTGSEVTPYASIIDEKNKQKISLAHRHIYPDVAIVDPSLTLTLPRRITAITGMDALTQGMESYWSVNANSKSDPYALTTVKLAFENLREACNHPENIEFRKNMTKASLLSGAAISHTETTIVHSVSYPITVYFNVPHGLACSLTLPYFMEYNSEGVPERILDISKIMGAENISGGVRRLKKLISDIGLETKLSQLGIKKEDIEIIIKKGFRPDRAGNNPRKVTKGDLREILTKIL